MSQLKEKVIIYYINNGPQTPTQKIQLNDIRKSPRPTIKKTFQKNIKTSGSKIKETLKKNYRTIIVEDNSIINQLKQEVVAIVKPNRNSYKNLAQKQELERDRQLWFNCIEIIFIFILFALFFIL